MIFSAFPGARADTDVTLTVLHTNDFHGASMKLLGVRAALIKKIRAEATHPVLLLDAGDVFTRGPYAKKFNGELEFAVFNELRYDALTLGNNEFKVSRAILEQRIRQAGFPILAANVKINGSQLLSGVKPYIIKDYEGFRVAILGVTSLKPVFYPETKGMQFANPVSTCSAVVKELGGKADAVLALTHIGIWGDKSLATSVPGISAIIGGDSHTAIQSPVKVNGIPIVQAGSNGWYLGRLDLTFERNAAGAWCLKKYQGKLYNLRESDLNPDPETQELIEEYIRTAGKKAS